MRSQRKNAIYPLVLMVGIALFVVAGLLWWVNNHAPTVQAASETGGDVPPAHHGDVRVTWASTVPDTFTVDTFGGIWPVTGYPVTITFPDGAVPTYVGAVFTFTPELSTTLPSPSDATPYFFNLQGSYMEGGKSVYLAALIWVDIQYEELDLGSIPEVSLHSYRSLYGQGDWNHLEWTGESTVVDSGHDLLRLNIKQLGHFGIGGYRRQIFLPIMLRSDTMGSSMPRQSPDLSLGQ